MKDEIIIKTPATSANLGPGFDCLGLALDFFNETKVKRSNYFKIRIEGEGSDNQYLKTHNMFVNIFNEVYSQLSDDKHSFEFEFKNNIPLSRGMGSSSSIIVGAIASAYYFSGYGINKEIILNKALEYEPHPDNITPATFGGFNCAVVENKQIKFFNTDISNDIKAIIAVPNKITSTNQSRLTLPKTVSLKDAVHNLSYSSLLTAAFVSKNYELLRIACKDVLHENIRMSNIPELFDIRKISLENGALMSTLSGSGSSFLTIAYKDDIEDIIKKLNTKFSEINFKILDFNNSGFEIIS